MFGKISVMNQCGHWVYFDGSAPNVGDEISCGVCKEPTKVARIDGYPYNITCCECRYRTSARDMTFACRAVRLHQLSHKTHVMEVSSIRYMKKSRVLAPLDLAPKSVSRSSEIPY